MELEIEHFSHKHPLLLNLKMKDDNVSCKACKRICLGSAYSCTRCRFYLHEKCTKLQQELHNFLDEHPLTLKSTDHLHRAVRCYACKNFTSGFIFHCNKCDLSLDVECAFIRPAKAKRDALLRTHFSHRHPLVLLEKMPNNRIKCRVCARYCSDPTYGCSPCFFYLHRSCFELDLPREILHFYHPCPLTLHTDPDKTSGRRDGDFICRACQQSPPWGTFSHSCSRCRFVMDINCTLLPTSESENSREQIHHFLHGHPLSLSKIKEGQKVNCYVCGKGCTGPTYARGRPSCQGVYIDNSCLELPREICHPLHPYHPLTLLHHTLSEICNACRKDSFGFVYSCQYYNCSFRLHMECSTTKPVITYEGHSHLLHFKENMDYIVQCSACNSDCESYAISCLYCDFNLHLRCGPLPCSIKYNCHIDPLILINSLAEHENETDDEFYCDACEEKSDPLLPAYQCTECHFVAEISCVISEVIASLKGECGDVELRNSLGQFGKVVTSKKATKEMIKTKEEQIKPAITLYDILQSLSEDENEEVTSILQARERERVSAKERLTSNHDEDKYEVFSDKTYTQFIEFLEHGAETAIAFYNGHEIFIDAQRDTPVYVFKQVPQEEVVNVENYMVTRKLAPVLKNLLSKRGDIGAESMLSPKVKLYFFNMLCECIYSMKHTKVVDITEDLLLNRWTSLKTLQLARFKIQFAFDHLKRVVHAHFGLYVREKLDSTLYKLDRDIAELYEDIQALKEKRECITSAEFAKSSLIEECLREASILKKGKGDIFGLLQMSTYGVKRLCMHECLFLWILVCLIYVLES